MHVCHSEEHKDEADGGRERERTHTHTHTHAHTQVGWAYLTDEGSHCLDGCRGSAAIRALTIDTRPPLHGGGRVPTWWWAGTNVVVGGYQRGGGRVPTPEVRLSALCGADGLILG